MAEGQGMGWEGDVRGRMAIGRLGGGGAMVAGAQATGDKDV